MDARCHGPAVAPFRSLFQGTRVTCVYRSTERFAGSQQFDQVFREGMALVEATANYLEGPGRRDAKGLAPVAATAAESLTSLRIASYAFSAALNCGASRSAPA